MKHLKVLVLTTDTLPLKILNWKVTLVGTVETALDHLHHGGYKVVAIHNGISKADRDKLYKLAPILFEHLILVDYADDALITEAVNRAYWPTKKQTATRQYLDNAFELKLAHRISLH